MAGLVLRDVNKLYSGGHHVIHDFNLEIDHKEFLVLTGPEGCGKSTVLRMIAGLEEVSSGQIFMDGVDVTDAEPRDRDLAMVFKNNVLFPGLTAAENMAFSLRMGKKNPNEVEEQVMETAKLLSITALLDKKPEELSEFETFQVLLGRALVRKPAVLLIDSTIGNLEDSLQDRLRQMLLNAWRELNLVVIYAAGKHEAARMPEARLVLINDGMIFQDGRAAEIYEKPNCYFSAEFLSDPAMNFFPAETAEGEEGLKLLVSGGRLTARKEIGEILKAEGYLGRQILLGIRPENLKLPEEEGKNEGFQGIFEEAREFNGQYLLRYTMGDSEGQVLSDRIPGCGEGGKIFLEADAEKIFFFDIETGKNLIL